MFGVILSIIVGISLFIVKKPYLLLGLYFLSIFVYAYYTPISDTYYVHDETFIRYQIGNFFGDCNIHNLCFSEEFTVENGTERYISPVQFSGSPITIGTVTITPEKEADYPVFRYLNYIPKSITIGNTVYSLTTTAIYYTKTAKNMLISALVVMFLPVSVIVIASDEFTRREKILLAAVYVVTALLVVMVL